MQLPTMVWLLIFTIVAASSSFADDRRVEPSEVVKTAKERLVSKAVDPQRLNDCKVPVELRDANRPRPDDCRKMAEIKIPGKKTSGTE